MKKSVPEDRLAVLRRRVDAVDRRLVRLLAARQRLVRSMRPYKTGLRDARREAAILRMVARRAAGLGLDRTFAKDVYRALLSASRTFQKRADRG